MNMNELLSEFTAVPAMNMEGHFSVNDNTKRNLLKKQDTSIKNVMRAVSYSHPEILNNHEMYNAVVEFIKSEMNPQESKIR